MHSSPKHGTDASKHPLHLPLHPHGWGYLGCKTLPGEMISNDREGLRHKMCERINFLN